MAKLDDVIIENKTLLKVDEALEQQQKLETPRNYMGMSMIAEECWRKVFYDFRNCVKREIKASGIKAIQDGFAQEDIMIKRLRMLPFIELHTVDPQDPSKQIGFTSLLGHLRGHADGIIKGIVEAPLTWHVWENKAVNQKKFDKFNALKISLSEKNALQEWDGVYYGQAQLYMHFSELERHYITIQSPGGREFTSARTEYNRKHAEMLIGKARMLIFDNFTLPSKMSKDREYFKCKWCQFQEICHDGDIPDVHCKTCRYRECVADGKSKCLHNDTIISDGMLNVGCDNHIFNPTLIQAELLEHQETGCLYKAPSGVIFSNNSLTGFSEYNNLTKGDLEIFTSKELKEKIKNVNNMEKSALTVANVFNGEILKDSESKKWESGKSTNFDSRLKGI